MDLYFNESSNRGTWKRYRYNRKIKIAKSKNEEVVRMVKEMKKAGVKVLQEDK